MLEMDLKYCKPQTFHNHKIFHCKLAFSHLKLAFSHLKWTKLYAEGSTGIDTSSVMRGFLPLIFGQTPSPENHAKLLFTTGIPSGLRSAYYIKI
jgi:hypothetical protein